MYTAFANLRRTLRIKKSFIWGLYINWYYGNKTILILCCLVLLCYNHIFVLQTILYNLCAPDVNACTENTIKSCIINSQCNWLLLIFYKPEARVEILRRRNAFFLDSSNHSSDGFVGCACLIRWCEDSRESIVFVQPNIGQIKTLGIWCAVLEVQA